MVVPCEGAQGCHCKGLKVVYVGAAAVIAVHASHCAVRHRLQQRLHVLLGSLGHNPFGACRLSGCSGRLDPGGPLFQKALGVRRRRTSLQCDQCSCSSRAATSAIRLCTELVSSRLSSWYSFTSSGPAVPAYTLRSSQTNRWRCLSARPE